MFLLQDLGNTNSFNNFHKYFQHFSLHKFILDPENPAATVGFLFHNNLLPQIKNSQFKAESKLAWLEIHINKEIPSLKIGNLYCPPKPTSQQINQIIQTLSQEKFDILGGDLNDFANYQLDKFSTKNNNKSQSNQSSTLLKQISNLKMFIDSFRFIHPDEKKYSRVQTLQEQQGTKYTTASRIDLFLVHKTKKQLIEQADILNKTEFISDHCPIMLALSLQNQNKKHPPQKTNPYQHKKLNPKEKFKLSNGEFALELQRKLFHNIPSKQLPLMQPQETIKEIQQTILQTVDYTIGWAEPRNCTNKGKYNPTLIQRHQKLKGLRKKITSLYHQIDLTKPNIPEAVQNYQNLEFDVQSQDIPFSPLSNNPTISDILHSLNQIKNTITKKMVKMKKQAKSKYIQSRIRTIKKRIDQRNDTVFQVLREKDSQSLHTIIKHDPSTDTYKIFSTPEQVKTQTAIDREECFKYEPPPEKINTFFWYKHVPSIPDNQTFMPDFSPKNIHHILTKLKINSAPSLDHISNEILKFADNESMTLSTLLSYTFTKLFQTGTTPNCWKESICHGIYKNNGAPFITTSYRPITLLPCLYKVYTAILNQALQKNIQIHHLLPQNQYGFTTHNSTSQPIFKLINKLADANKNNQEIHILYIDFKQAFDSVQHWALELTLENMKFDPTFIKAIISTLTDTTSFATTPYGLSDPFSIEAGVRQGDITSPALFNLYLAPLLFKLDAINNNQNNSDPYLAFADDIALINKSHEETHSSLKIIQQFGDTFKIHLNPSKCAYATNSLNPNHTIKIKDTPIESLGTNKCYKYLGLWTNLSLDFSQQLDTSKRVLKQSVSQICNKKYLPTADKITLINAVSNMSPAYRFQFILPPKEWLQQLDTWIIKKLNQTRGIPPETSPEFWYLHRKLTSLRDLALATYASTAFNLSYNLNNAQSEANNKMFETLNEKYIPSIDTALQRIQWHVTNTNELGNAEITHPDILESEMKHARNTHRKFVSNNITHWYQLTDLNNKLYDDSTLINIFGADKYEIRNDHWKRLIQQHFKQGILEPNLQRYSHKDHFLDKILPSDDPQPTMLENKTIVWTDGTLKDSIAHSAIWWSPNNPTNFTFHTNGPQTVFNAELQAIEATMMKLPDQPSIIFSDCLSVVSKIQHLQTEQNKRLLLRTSKYRPTFERILQLQKQRNHPVEIIHTYSHLLDENAENKVKDYSRKMQEMQSKFPHSWETILFGNQQADSLFQTSISKKTPSIIFPPGLHTFEFCNFRNEPQIGNCRKLACYLCTKLNKI